MWARDQMKTGSQFDAATQYAIIAAITALIKEYGGEKGGLSVELVNQAIRNAYLTVNNNPVGKIWEKADGAARALYTQARPEAEGGGQGPGCRPRWPKKQVTPEEALALRQECVSLKNQLSQAKAQIETLKALAAGSSDKKPETVNPTAGDKRKFETVQAKKAKVAPPKVSPQPQATAKANDFKISSTGDQQSDSEYDDNDESDDDERHVKSKSNLQVPELLWPVQFQSKVLQLKHPSLCTHRRHQ
jgi:hypothetical protein